MKYLFNLVLFVGLIVYFCLHNIVYVLYKILWQLKFPTWEDIKEANTYYILDVKGRCKYYTNIFYYFYDINEKVKPLYPRASYRK